MESNTLMAGDMEGGRKQISESFLNFKSVEDYLADFTVESHILTLSFCLVIAKQGARSVSSGSIVLPFCASGLYLCPMRWQPLGLAVCLFMPGQTKATALKSQNIDHIFIPVILTYVKKVLWGPSRLS